MKLRLLYLLYFMLTSKERQMYSVGLSRGMRVVQLKYDATGATVTYDPTKKPVRTFLTWEEFKAARGSAS